MPLAMAVGTIFDIATAGGIIGLVLVTACRIEDRETWAANTAVLGFGIGVLAYAISLLT